MQRISIFIFLISFVLGQPDSWSTFPPSNTARMRACASSFGSKVYVFGGLSQDSTAALNTVEVFDSISKTWSFSVPLPIVLHSASASSFNNYIYVVGGFTSNWQPSNRVFRFNPNAQVWDEVAPMNVARGALTTSWLENNLYAVGGSNLTNSLSINEAYNPFTNSWQIKAPMNIENKEYERDHLVSGAVAGKLYVIGGRNPYNLALNMEYNPTSDSWTIKSPMPTNRSDSAAVVYSGSIFVFGGEGSNIFDNTEEYVVGFDFWKCRTKMSEGKHGHSAVSIGNFIFAINGETSLGITADNLAYSPPLSNSSGTCPPPSSDAISLSLKIYVVLIALLFVL